MIGVPANEAQHHVISEHNTCIAYGSCLMGLTYFLTSQKTSTGHLFLSVSQNTQSKNIHHSYLFLSSRISLFLAWSSAIIGPPPIPPPCVTTGTTHKVLTLQIVEVYYKLGSHPRVVFSVVFFQTIQDSHLLVFSRVLSSAI
jgi:hypothetical protein